MSEEPGAVQGTEPSAARSPEASGAERNGAGGFTVPGASASPTVELDAVELLATAGEREQLEGVLDFYREVITRKLHGVSEADARRRPVPSATTLGGLVKHLRWVEQNWFLRGVAGTPPEELPTPPYTDADPDADFRLEPGETVAGVLAAYRANCELSRRAAAGRQLDQRFDHPRIGPTTLRWVYLHIIEETARHAGHADILREQIDGSTGDG